jgi:Thioredoxin domain
VRLAHQFAMESDLCTADCIEATEFPELSGKYRVYAVPKTMINGRRSVEGALPEEFFLDGVLRMLESSVGSDAESETVG